MAIKKNDANTEAQNVAERFLQVSRLGIEYHPFLTEAFHAASLRQEALRYLSLATPSWNHIPDSIKKVLDSGFRCMLNSVENDFSPRIVEKNFSKAGKKNESCAQKAVLPHLPSESTIPLGERLNYLHPSSEFHRMITQFSGNAKNPDFDRERPPKGIPQRRFSLASLRFFIPEDQKAVFVLQDLMEFLEERVAVRCAFLEADNPMGEESYFSRIVSYLCLYLYTPILVIKKGYNLSQRQVDKKLEALHQKGVSHIHFIFNEESLSRQNFILLRNFFKARVLKILTVTSMYIKEDGQLSSAGLDRVLGDPDFNRVNYHFCIGRQTGKDGPMAKDILLGNSPIPVELAVGTKGIAGLYGQQGELFGQWDLRKNNWQADAKQYFYQMF